MNLAIFGKDIQVLFNKFDKVSNELDRHEYTSDNKRVQINFAKLSQSEIDEFEILLKAGAEREEKFYVGAYRSFCDWKSLLTDTSGAKPVAKLDQLPSVIKAYLKNSPHKWVFCQDSDGQMNPYFIKEIEHKKGYTDRSTGHWVPPFTTIDLIAYRQGSNKKKSFTWRTYDLPKTVPNLLASTGMLIETDEAVASYKEEFARYVEIQTKTGCQMSAFGEGKAVGKSSWNTKKIAMFREGAATKVVIDDEGDDETTRVEQTFINDSFWGDIPDRSGMSERHRKGDDDENDTDDEEPNRVELPIHPYLSVFDLQKHLWVNIHSAYIEDYKWDKTLGKKLIINEDDKKLINLLMNQSGSRIEDIIKGKMSGVIVLATGSPGIGKTLTAEVFSEMIEKPLYTVQCSQLGIDVDSIEKKLQSTLNRASRWGAILLIDEADVYIRERGHDIEQNAIVGVFLHLIEYYRGVLFMTSNRGDQIDDAIISRATAWIKYDLPDQVQLREIWKVLSAQYKVSLSESDLDKLMQPLQNISGRTVRNLLKLARMLKGDDEVTVDDVLSVSKYQSLK